MNIFKKGNAAVRWSRGFTLLELIIILSIIGGASAVMAMTFSEATRVTSSDMAQALVLAQVHQASDSIAKDVASADNITATSGGNLCSMTCYQWSGSAFTRSTVTYTITSGNLLRNGKYIAQYIDPASTSLIKVPPTITENNTYLLTIRAAKSVGTNKYASDNITFKFYQRMPPLLGAL
ncbi:MAG: hypothetical protein ABSB31_04020 [Dehalococcoidia bacterium]|jgi:type II secretory pathway pseudopilin PulG